MQVWLLSGARRGVGKTHLARSLCALLPNSSYAKLGHHARKHGKSANYFTSSEDLVAFVNEQQGQCAHCVIESHSFAHAQGDPIRIFLDAPAQAAGLRSDVDELRQTADICVCVKAEPVEWLSVLAKRLANAELREAVLGLLHEQQRRLAWGGIEVRSKVWLINDAGERVFGSGLARLLEDISHLGSIAAAVERSGMSYRYIWGQLKEAEAALGCKLLLRKPGGEGGGGSELTPDAKRTLRLYYRLNARVQQVADQEFANLASAEVSHET